MFIFSFIGTIIFSLLGYLVSIFSNKLPKIINSILQAFSIGAIIGILFFDILIESFEGFETYNLGYLIASSIIIFVFLMFYFIHLIMDKLLNKKILKHAEEHDCEGHDLHFDENKSTLISSIMLIFSILIHNIPEGMSLGVTFLNNYYYGIIMSLVVIGFHNFSVSFTLSQSMKETNMSKPIIFLNISLISLVSYVFSITGYFIGSLNDLANSIMICISGGSLLFVLLKELLPVYFKKYNDKYSSIIISISIILVGLLIFFIGGLH